MTEESKEQVRVKAVIREICKVCGCPHGVRELCMIEVMENNRITIEKENTLRVSG